MSDAAGRITTIVATTLLLLVALAVPGSARPLAGESGDDCNGRHCSDEDWCEGNGRDGNRSSRRGNSANCRDDERGSDGKQAGERDERPSAGDRDGQDRLCPDRVEVGVKTSGVGIDLSAECALVRRYVSYRDGVLRVTAEAADERITLEVDTNVGLPVRR